jgi:hypothetical protein
MNIFFWENLVLSVVIFGWGIWREEPSLGEARARLAVA